MRVFQNLNNNWVIEFSSKEPFYTLESIGHKSNTYRVLNMEEYDEIIDKEPTEIRIMLKDNIGDKYIDGFQRKISHILHIKTDHIYNTYTFLFSWG